MYLTPPRRSVLADLASDYNFAISMIVRAASLHDLRMLQDDKHRHAAELSATELEEWRGLKTCCEKAISGITGLVAELNALADKQDADAARTKRALAMLDKVEAQEADAKKGKK